MAELLTDNEFELFRKKIYDESGITFSETNRSILDSRITYVIYALGIFSILLTIYMALTSPNGSTIYFGYTSPNVIFTSISILLFFHRNPMNLSTRFTNIVSEISACTYGIYLIHMYILIQVFFRVHRFIESLVPLTIICVGIAFVGGGFCVYVLRKIPIINKYKGPNRLLSTVWPSNS